jgi:hypothetical protein
MESGEPLYITPLSDLHADSNEFDARGFERTMRERAKLPNHRAIIIGDAMDLVVPPDLKRWRASVQDRSIIGRDDWLNAAVDLVAERLLNTGVKYDMIAPGNHEDSCVKFHGIDVTSMLARELRCARGGYSGYVEYIIRSKTGDSPPARRVPIFRLLYHHGAWGGGVSKGFGGARDWCRGFDQWAIFLYGHNHQTMVHRETRIRPKRNGGITEYPVYIICCGAWVHNYSDDAKITHYAERAGHMPIGRQTPLIKAMAHNYGGNKGWELEYTVEV